MIDEEDLRPGILCTKSFQTLENTLGYGKVPSIVLAIIKTMRKIDHSTVFTLQVENLLQYRLEDPEINPIYDKQSELLPIKLLAPDCMELSVL